VNALCDVTRGYAPVVGRILMALLFLTSAYGKITAFDATASAMASRGMPLTQLLLACAIAIELAGSLLLVIGWHTRLAALALVIFMVPATLYFHNYWSYGPEQVRNQRNHFMKNVTILGALVFVMGMGAGPLSIDQRKRRESA
jgi:putative oxidoreductase